MKSTRREKVPPPTAGLSKRERQTWLELAAALDQAGTWGGAPDLPAFRLLVVSVALAGSPDAAEDMPATARVRLLQTTSAMLANWGLTPATRGKVSWAVEAYASRSRISDS